MSTTHAAKSKTEPQLGRSKTAPKSRRNDRHIDDIRDLVGAAKDALIKEMRDGLVDHLVLAQIIRDGAEALTAHAALMGDDE